MMEFRRWRLLAAPGLAGLSFAFLIGASAADAERVPRASAQGSGVAEGAEGSIGEVEAERRTLWTQLRALELELAALTPLVPSAKRLARFGEFYKNEKQQLERTLAASSTLEALAEIETTWRSEREQLDRWMAELARDLGAIDAIRRRLEGDIGTWTEALASARNSEEPTRRVEDIEAALADLRAVEEATGRRRADLLLREERTAGASRLVSEALGLVVEKQHQLRSRSRRRYSGEGAAGPARV